MNDAGKPTRRLSLSWNSNAGVQPAVLARWAKELENRLRFVQGTRFTEIFGLPEEEILVEVNERAIAATSLTLAEIAKSIRERDSQTPDATSQSQRFKMPVRLAGDVDDLDRLRNVVLKGSDEGSPLRLCDIASIQRSEKRPVTTSSFVDGQRAVVIGTRMDADYIIDSWTQRHVSALEEFEETLPAGIELKVLFNQKKYTDERSNKLYGSLGLGMVLVIIVVWLMMGWRAAIPICTALPLSLLGVFFLMIPFGVSLHQMSIAGLILALGMLIDNPIIVTDDIQRRLVNLAEFMAEHGADRVEVSAIAQFIGACMNGDAQQARELVAANAQLPAEALKKHDELVHIVAGSGRNDTLRLLVEFGADINRLTRNTPLHEAAWANQLDTIKLLLELGADLTIRDRSHVASPLQWAVHHGGCAETVEFLATCDLDIFDAIVADNKNRVQNILDATPDQMEICYRSVREESALPHANDWQTPLAFAALRDRAEIVELLIANGANTNLTDVSGRTLIDQVQEKSLDEIVRLLSS